METGSPKSYYLFGLRVASSVDLDLPEAAWSGKADVRISIGDLHEGPEPIPDTGTPDRVELWWDDFGKFVISEGRSVVFHPVSREAVSKSAPILTGATFGVLLFQRGYLVLHGSAVCRDNSVTAFLGVKGAGKSTMAAVLVSRGFEFVTDDIVAIRPADQGRWEVIPGPSRFKLWPQSVEAVYQTDADHLPRLHKDIDKRLVRLPVGSQEPRVLTSIFALEVGDTLSYRPIEGSSAFMQLMAHSYASRFIGVGGMTPEHFSRCTSLAADLPMHELMQANDIAALSDGVDIVLEKISASEVLA